MKRLQLVRRLRAGHLGKHEANQPVTLFAASTLKTTRHHEYI